VLELELVEVMAMAMEMGKVMEDVWFLAQYSES
jgi:hypothetical protein